MVVVSTLPEKVTIVDSDELGSSGEVDLNNPLGLVNFKEVQGRCFDAQVVLKMAQRFQMSALF